MFYYRRFVFILRFNKAKIVSIPRTIQIERSFEFLRALGDISPIMNNWYLKGDSLQDALTKNVTLNPTFLIEKIQDNFDPEYPDELDFAVWNGEEDLLKGGLAFSYSAHNLHSMSAMRFEGAGSLLATLPNAYSVLLKIITLAVNIWPEIDWATITPATYYRSGRVFKDRQTIGWIGYCPHTLTKEMLPEAEALIPIPERGTIVVSCRDVMDEKNKAHYERVGDIDTKLVELGYLPIFNT
ncbi:Imm52 family immunity protein [Metapseudomonas otitidis]|uniref:Imm52 family immunity protein n=1 Tax=Metapseudomonas otitidis TaxID=319939 RepID=UPI0013F5D10D|nr:Imm52 family immunity protein [Pseudomonas otitidis]